MENKSARFYKPSNQSVEKLYSLFQFQSYIYAKSSRILEFCHYGHKQDLKLYYIHNLLLNQDYILNKIRKG